MAKIYDHTFSPWKGQNGTRVVAAEKTWSEPLKWDRAAAKAGERHRVFCASLADVFEDWQGPMVSSGGDRLFACVKCGHWGTSLLICEQCLDEDKWHLRQPVSIGDVRFKLFRLIDATPNLDWLLLTKRPENIARMWPVATCRNCGNAATCYGKYEDDAGFACDECCGHGCEDGWCEPANGTFRKNVWLLTSVSDQQTADAMIPQLLQCCNLAPVLGLSMEPLVGPVDIKFAMPWEQVGVAYKESIGWVIVGGESGHGARPMHPQWAVDIRNQCQAAGVPFFFKQWGNWIEDDGRVNKRGGDPWPHIWLAQNGTQYGGFDTGRIRMRNVGKDAAGRLLDGRTWDEFPKASVTNG